MRETDALERPYEVPTDVRLPPAQAEARGAGMRMMVGVPILAPGGNLEGPEPPHVHAGVLDAFFGVSEMSEAVYEALHVQRINQANRADPEKPHPTEAEQNSREERENDDWSFEPAPCGVHALGQFRSPPLFIRGLRLIEPAQVSPPEAALFGTGNIIRRVSDGMMKPVISDPAGGMAGAVENRSKDEYLLDNLIDLERLVGQQPMIANRGTEPAECDKQDR